MIEDLGDLQNALLRYSDDDKLNVQLTGEFGSFRGDYSVLYIGVDLNGTDYSSVGLLQSVIDDALEQSIMYGYKGGEYNIDNHTKFVFASDYKSVLGFTLLNTRLDFKGVILEVDEYEY